MTFKRDAVSLNDDIINIPGEKVVSPAAGNSISFVFELVYFDGSVSLVNKCSCHMPWHYLSCFTAIDQVRLSHEGVGAYLVHHGRATGGEVDRGLEEGVD